MIKVGKEILEGLEYVRKSGETNMFDMKKVQKIAFDNKYYETVNWLESVDKKTYGTGIMTGFELEEK